MDNFIIKKIGSTEIDRAAPLFNNYRVFYGKESDIESAKQFLKNRFENNEIITFLVEDQDGKAIAFSNIYESFSSVSLGPIWILNDLYVASDYRRQGIAEMLMKHIEQEAVKADILSLQLETANDNDAAQACYKKQGWKISDFYTYSISTSDIKNKETL